jgi:hypothetical protein
VSRAVRSVLLVVAVVLGAAAAGCDRESAPAAGDGGNDLIRNDGGGDSSLGDTGEGDLHAADTGEDRGRVDAVVEDRAPDTVAPDVDTGACPDPSAPNVDYVADSAEECAVVDFGCPEGWDGFDAGECGCGCQIAECRPRLISGTSGMAEAFDLGARCEFFIACAPTNLSANDLDETVRGYFPEARCGDGTTFGCPDGTASFCEVYIEDVDASEVVAACAVSLVEGVRRIFCGGDL